jgi:hypothetical protein
MSPLPGATRLPLLPSRGFVNSVPRDEVPIDCLTGPSKNWLVTKGRLRRRAGSTIYGDTLSSGSEVTGVLESKTGMLARRMLSVTLQSLADGYPSPLTLYTYEASKEATLAFRNTNGTDDWCVPAQEYSATYYPCDTTIGTVPAHRVVPMVYRNEYGGLTLHRLTTAEYRRHLCAGSRSIIQVGKDIVWGGFDSAPGRWNGGFNDASTGAAEVCEVGPLGMIPPLGMPLAVKGVYCGASTTGPWKGSDAFFYSIGFENERGELSMFTIPRPADSAYPDFPGYGYIHIDPDNPTYYYDSVMIYNIPVGPSGTRWVNIYRSTKVDVATTGAGAIVSPCADDLQFCGRVPNGTTTYKDTNGNDLSLVPDYRLQQMFGDVNGAGGLCWPPCARYIGGFDGRKTLAYLRPNPYALILAPWESGQRNGLISSAAIYQWPAYGVAVTPTKLSLRKYIGGSTLAMTHCSNDKDNYATVVAVNQVHTLPAGVNVAGTGIPASTTVVSFDPFVDQACATTDTSVTVTVADNRRLRVGQLVTGTGIPTGAKIESKAGTPFTSIDLTLAATATTNPVTLTFHQATLSAVCTSTNADITITYTAYSSDTEYDLADYTLRQLCDKINTAWAQGSNVTLACTWSHYFPFDKTIITAADPASVKVGMAVITSAITGLAHVTKVTNLYPAASTIMIDKGFDRGNYDATENISFEVLTASTGGGTGTWAAQVVPGADADEGADSLLRTLVAAENCTWTSGEKKLTLAATTNAAYISPGMLPHHADVQSGTVVTEVNTTTGVLKLSKAVTDSSTGAEAVTFAYDTGDYTMVGGYGYVRSFANSFPVVLPWNLTYLDGFKVDTDASIFTAGTPGYPSDAVNTWLVSNRRSGPAEFGIHVGMADMGPVQLEFYARGRMVLANTRTGTTHQDGDYTKPVVSWTRGARSPYAICSGNGWAIFVSDDGVFACDAGQGEVLLSKAIYDHEAQEGDRGELEYAITQSIAASEGDTDGYKIAAQVHGSVLHVRYWSSSSATYFDREIRYDFSASTGRNGLAEVLDAQGRPYPWSAPLYLPVSCSAWVGRSDGLHHYAARDTNAGTYDGRVDEIDTGTTDNGTVVQARGYSGVMVPDALTLPQVLGVRGVLRKAGTGVSVGLSCSPERLETSAEWDDLAIPSSGGDDFGRFQIDFGKSARYTRKALQARITDDGSGACPELSMATLNTEPQADKGDAKAAS